MPARVALSVKHSIPQGPNDVQHFFQTRDLGKKSPNAPAQNVLKFYLSPTLV